MPTTCNCGMCDNYSFFQDQNNVPRGSSSRPTSSQPTRSNRSRPIRGRSTMGGSVVYGAAPERRRREVARPVPIPASYRSMFTESSSSEESIRSVGSDRWVQDQNNVQRGSTIIRTNDGHVVYGPVRYADNSTIPYSGIVMESLSERALPISARSISNRVPPRSDEEDSQRRRREVARPVPIPASYRSMFNESSSSEESIPSVRSDEGIQEDDLPPIQEESDRGRVFTLAARTCETCGYSTMFNESSCYCDSSSSEESLAQESPRHVAPAPLRNASTADSRCAARLLASSDEELELSMALFAAWTEENEEAVADTHDSLLMAALLSTMEESSETSVAIHATSCQNLLMNSLGGQRRVPVHKPALSTIAEETSITCSCCSISTSNLFSDRPTTLPYPMPSAISVTGSAIVPYTLSASSLAISASEVSMTSSSLFKDPTSAHSSSSSLLHMSTISFSCASSSSDHGYETDVDSAPVVRKSTVPEMAQTEDTDKASAARLIAECDEMVEKLEEKKKKLKELL